MQNTVSVGLVGDYDHAVPAHQAIPLALQHAADSLGIKLAFGWVPTTEISTVSRISSFNGIWCVPASPYRNTEEHFWQSATHGKAKCHSLVPVVASSMR